MVVLLGAISRQLVPNLIWDILDDVLDGVPEGLSWLTLLPLDPFYEVEHPFLFCGIKRPEPFDNSLFNT